MLYVVLDVLVLALVIRLAIGGGTGRGRTCS
jgi:hypothetical protein